MGNAIENSQNAQNEAHKWKFQLRLASVDSEYVCLFFGGQYQNRGMI